MITGHPSRCFRCGTWNCTYICPIVIWLGAPAVDDAAKLVTFCTPPMKKLPWSSIVSGPVRKRRCRCPVWSA
jgi:hypothetical protein